MVAFKNVENFSFQRLKKHKQKSVAWDYCTWGWKRTLANSGDKMPDSECETQTIQKQSTCTMENKSSH